MTPAERLRALADAYGDAPPDVYGADGIVGALEAEVAALLKKEAAVFGVSGKTLQNAALRVHAERRGRVVVAAHPRAHLVEDEDDAIGRLWGLRVARVGPLAAPFTAADLAAVRDELAAVLVELPLRRAAYAPTPWDELVAIAAAARERGAALAIDGARLWEIQPWYARPFAEIAALAETVYVSFYKGLGGLAGGALAGDRATVDAVRAWNARAGGAPYRAYPYHVAAREGLRRNLPRMAAWRDHARAAAAALAAVDGVETVPADPACNAFLVLVDADAARFADAVARVERERGMPLVRGSAAAATYPRRLAFECVVDERSEDRDPAAFADALRAAVALARE